MSEDLILMNILKNSEKIENTPEFKKKLSLDIGSTKVALNHIKNEYYELLSQSSGRNISKLKEIDLTDPNRKCSSNYRKFASVKLTFDELNNGINFDSLISVSFIPFPVGIEISDPNFRGFMKKGIDMAKKLINMSQQFRFNLYQNQAVSRFLMESTPFGKFVFSKFKILVGETFDVNIDLLKLVNLIYYKYQTNIDNEKTLNEGRKNTLNRIKSQYKNYKLSPSKNAFIRTFFIEFMKWDFNKTIGENLVNNKERANKFSQIQQTEEIEEKRLEAQDPPESLEKTSQTPNSSQVTVSSAEETKDEDRTTEAETGSTQEITVPQKTKSSNVVRKKIEIEIRDRPITPPTSEKTPEDTPPCFDDQTFVIFKL